MSEWDKFAPQEVPVEGGNDHQDWSAFNPQPQSAFLSPPKAPSQKSWVDRVKDGLGAIKTNAPNVTIGDLASEAADEAAGGVRSMAHALLPGKAIDPAINLEGKLFGYSPEKIQALKDSEADNKDFSRDASDRALQGVGGLFGTLFAIPGAVVHKYVSEPFGEGSNNLVPSEVTDMAAGMLIGGAAGMAGRMRGVNPAEVPHNPGAGPRVSGGPGDLPNYARATEATASAPWKTFEGEPRDMTSQELAQAKIQSPTDAVVSSRNFDAVKVETKDGSVRVSTASKDQLPPDLRGAKPRYRTAEVAFDNDVDKAMYITAQEKPSKRDADYRTFLKDQGYTDKEIETYGQQVRDELKGQHANTEDGETVRLGRVTPPKTPTPENAVRVNIDPKNIMDSNEPAPAALHKIVREEYGLGVESKATAGEIYSKLSDMIGEAEANDVLKSIGAKGLKNGDEVTVLDHREVEPITDEKGTPVMADRPNTEKLPPPSPKEKEPVQILGSHQNQIIGTDPALMERSFNANASFEEQRAGTIPPEHLDTLAQELGVSVPELVKEGVGVKNLQNDTMVQRAIEALIRANQKAQELLQVSAASKSFKAMTDFFQQWMIHEQLHGYLSGKYAEWGRTGRIIQDYYNNFEPQPGTEAFRLKEEAMARQQDKVKAAIEAAKTADEKGTIEVTKDVVKKALGDETGNIFYEAKDGKLVAKSKDQLMQEFLEQHFGKHATMARLQEFIDTTAELLKNETTLNPAIRRKIMTNAFQGTRDLLKAEPGFYDKLQSMWRTNLLSGLFTHTDYVIGSQSIILPDAITRAISGLRGTPGELAAAGDMLRSWPGASLRAAGTAFKAMRLGWEQPTKGELLGMEARGEAAGGKVSPIHLEGQIGTRMWPLKVPGTEFEAGTALQNTVHRLLSAVTTYNKHVGANIAEDVAARAKVRDLGGVPTSGMRATQALVEARNSLTPDELVKASDYGKRVGNMEALEPGSLSFAWSQFAKQSPVLAWLEPFRKVVFNWTKHVQEMDVGMSMASPRIWKNLLGKNGEEAQFAAQNKLIAAASFAGATGAMYAADIITDGGPSDPAQREQWLKTNQPWSIKIGNDYQVGMKWLGPLGMAMMLTTQYLSIGKQLANTGVAMTEANWEHAQHYAHEAAGRLAMTMAHVIDRAGFQSLGEIVASITHPREAERIALKSGLGMIGGMVPGSTMVNQASSAFDPFMREQASALDTLLAKTPFRFMLDPKLDSEGQPRQNLKFTPFGAVFEVGNYPQKELYSEYQRLGVNANRVPHEINGVQVGPKMQYEWKQAYGEKLGQMNIEKLVEDPGWSKIPPQERRTVLHQLLSSAAEAATATVLSKHQEIPQKAIEDTVKYHESFTGPKSPWHAFTPPPERQ